ncbi:hypothetical protein GCM10028801_10220 [Nocardioides maradonensis]
MIRALPVAAHSHAASYDRASEYGDWTSADTPYGYCNTRARVLIAESSVPTTRNSYCTVSTGRWLSWYNGQTYTNAYGGRYLQIDHLESVPVKR